MHNTALQLSSNDVLIIPQAELISVWYSNKAGFNLIEKVPAAEGCRRILLENGMMHNNTDGN